MTPGHGQDRSYRDDIGYTRGTYFDITDKNLVNVSIINRVMNHHFENHLYENHRLTTHFLGAVAR